MGIYYRLKFSCDVSSVLFCRIYDAVRGGLKSLAVKFFYANGFGGYILIALPEVILTQWSGSAFSCVQNKTLFILIILL